MHNNNSPAKHSSQQQQPPPHAAAQRAVRSAWQDLKYHRTQWQDLDDVGLRTANHLVNLVLQHTIAKGKARWNPALSEVFGWEEKMEEGLKADLEQPVKDLDSTLGKMDGHLKKMQAVYMRLETLIDDTANNLGEQYVYDVSLFQTRTLDTHVTMFKKIIDMYAWEASLKFRIAETLPTLRERKHAMFYLSAWLQQPYLDVETLNEIDELWALETSDDVG
ncbi:hypothetical protein DFJ77DRAFT_505733 [Powellomyces hirtus]|nr:hypothetical protein DFJ77DRAFT_505733 [Powellomyces hirtus]